ncbi:MAG: transcriptional regulator [Chitinophagaceae bacterium]|nr:MAG: transcriptional regulator [Chitinophagaceae bacterium]
MKLTEAKAAFIQTWARLGTEWGISRSMAQVHALLLVSDKALSTEDVMQELQISRGNANMNLRELVTWNLLSRELLPGERREFFRAEKDIWEVAKRIAKERKRRELEPLIRELDALKQVDDPAEPGAESFVHTVQDIRSFVAKADKGLETMLQADENWFFGTILKLLK